MKKKLIVSLLCVILVFNALGSNVYAQKNRSAVALSATTATAILTLATYAGIQFQDSESMDEFLSRMIGLPQFAEFGVSILALIKQSTDGVLKFSKDVISQFELMANKILITKSMDTVTYDGRKIPIIYNYRTLSSNKSFTAFVESMPYEMKVFSTGKDGSYETTQEAKRFRLGENTYITLKSFLTAKGYPRIFGTHRDNVIPDSNNNACMKFDLGMDYTTKTYIAIPIIYEHWEALRPAFVLGSWLESEQMWEWISMVSCTDIDMANEIQETIKPIKVVTSSSWEQGKGQVSTPSEGDLEFSIPSKMEDLVGMPSTDVQSNPTYDVWTPGIDITIPAIDSPSIDYTPDTSVDSPPSTDVPDTGSPGFPDFGEIPKIDLDLTPLQTGLGHITERFPFSLPWDMQRILESFSGKTPSQSNSPIIKFKFNGQDTTFDFKRFDSIAIILRGFIFTQVALGLLFVVRKLKL